VNNKEIITSLDINLPGKKQTLQEIENLKNFVEKHKNDWPSCGFLDSGEIIIDFDELRIQKSMRADDCEHTSIYGRFDFLDKKNQIFGMVVICDNKVYLDSYSITSDDVVYRMASSNFMLQLWDCEDVSCPKNCFTEKCNPLRVIMHLNDEHKYSFKQLSDWLRTVDFQAKVMPVFNTKNYLFGDLFENYRNAYRNRSCDNFRWSGEHTIKVA